MTERVVPWTTVSTSEDEVRRGILALLETAEEALPALTRFDDRVRIGELMLRMARETLPPESWRFETDPLLK